MSIVPHDGGMRLVCNRDERRDRPAAEPPRRRRAARISGVWPIDPSSGGTWIGANEAGLAFVLLNRNPAPRPVEDSDRPSRGTIIPRLLGLASLDEVRRRVAELAADTFEPFTLLVLRDRTLMVIRNVGRRIECRRSRVLAPRLFTSSSLGDGTVDAPRRALFGRMVRDAAAPLAGQAAFHRHQWRRRPELSVLMERSDARTVSRTVVEISRQRVQMRYQSFVGSPGAAGAAPITVVRHDC